MSQHRYGVDYQGRSATVLMGWDRPTQVFFMVVELAEARDDESEYPYSNLSDRELIRRPGLARDLAYFQVKLSELQLSVPALMLSEVRADARNNVGNRYVWYDANGRMQHDAAD